MTDAHCHLTDPAAVKAARAAGLRRLLVCGTHPEDWEQVVWLADQVQPFFGLHPWYATATGWEEALCVLLERFPKAGVGEIGLEHTRHAPDFSLQKAVFARQLALARELRRPCVLHCLRAWGSMLEALQNHGGKVLLHAYNGSTEMVPRLIQTGAWISLGPRELGRRPELARVVPADRLLLETDGPDSGYGPQDLPPLLDQVAQARGVSPASLMQQIEANMDAFLA